MVYDLTFMLIGPFDNYSRRVDASSGERLAPTWVEIVVCRMRVIFKLRQRFCSHVAL